MDYHIASQKHLKGKEITSREKRERDIAESLKLYDTIVHPVGEPYLRKLEFIESRW